MSGYYALLRPLLMRLDPEKAHALTLRLLRSRMLPLARGANDPALAVTLWNRRFPNPVGLAAGFDKNAEALGGAFRLGFGFVEAGTVTPRPQDGNPRPRVFRDPSAGAVINRMGFPGGGLTAFRANLDSFLETRPRPQGMLGINIGMNKGQTDPARDYCLLVQSLSPFADYLAVNISSPNTPGLRDLQDPSAFLELARTLVAERDRVCGAHKTPLLVKLAPDLTEAQQEGLAEAALASGIDGLILTNTTLDRPDGLDPDFAAERGGLSGRPLKTRSTETIRRFYRLTEGRLPIVGLGGVSSAVDAYEKIKAGASLVQVYTGLVYHGPALISSIKRGLGALLRRDGFKTIAEAVGTEGSGRKT